MLPAREARRLRTAHCRTDKADRDAPLLTTNSRRIVTFMLQSAGKRG